MIHSQRVEFIISNQVFCSLSNGSFFTQFLSVDGIDNIYLRSNRKDRISAKFAVAFSSSDFPYKRIDSVKRVRIENDEVHGVCRGIVMLSVRVRSGVVVVQPM